MISALAYFFFLLLFFFARQLRGSYHAVAKQEKNEQVLRSNADHCCIIFFLIFICRSVYNRSRKVLLNHLKCFTYMPVKFSKKTLSCQNRILFWTGTANSNLIRYWRFSIFLKVCQNYTKNLSIPCHFYPPFSCFTSTTVFFLQQDSTWSPINFSSTFSPKELGTVIITSLYRTDLFVRVLFSVVFECFYYTCVWCRVANLHNKK